MPDGVRTPGERDEKLNGKPETPFFAALKITLSMGSFPCRRGPGQLAFVKAGYNACFEPVDVQQRSGQSKIKLTRDGFRFFLILLKVVTIFSPLRVFVPVSLAAFAMGAGYAAWTAYWQHHITNSSVVLIVLSVVILLVGLVSEQISALRVEGRQ
jgi:hypothetical protein